jgi:hypothetical protein
MFRTKHLPGERDAVAPDGSDVRVLLELSGGGLAHFTLPPGETSIAVYHRTVEEIWYVISGQAQMWRHLVTRRRRSNWRRRTASRSRSAPVSRSARGVPTPLWPSG